MTALHVDCSFYRVKRKRGQMTIDLASAEFMNLGAAVKHKY